MQHSSLVRSAFYNNDGVQHMNKGCYNDAIAAFTLALEILKPTSAGIENNNNNGGNTSSIEDATTVTYSASSPMMTTRPQHSCVTTTTTATTTFSSSFDLDQNDDSFMMDDEDDCLYAMNCLAEEEEEQQQSQHQHTQTRPAANHGTTNNNNNNNSCYIFRDAIDIPIQSVIKSSVTEKIVTKLSIVVIYNLGLSFHLSAVQTNSLDRLMRARMLYEFAFEMHMEEGCDVTLLYTLALMNNLGLIYHLLGEGQRSHHCFQNMLSTMMFLLEADDARKIKQWDGLLSNVMKYMFIDSKVSAPAA